MVRVTFVRRAAAIEASVGSCVWTGFLDSHCGPVLQSGLDRHGKSAEDSPRGTRRTRTHAARTEATGRTCGVFPESAQEVKTMGKPSRRKLEKKRKAQRNRRREKPVSLAYCGKKYRTKELVTPMLHAEIGIYETFVITDRTI